MPMAGQLDIGFAHDSPLGRGFLRRSINARADPHKGACRLNDRPSSAENFAAITTMLRLLCRSLAPVHSLSRLYRALSRCYRQRLRHAQ